MDAVVRDADMIAVVGVLMRFNGADAPGLETCAGQDAKRWMVGDDWWASVLKRRIFRPTPTYLPSTFFTPTKCDVLSGNL